MYSLAWPSMFDSRNTHLVQDKEALKSNFKLLLNSERLELFGDPYYGTMLKPIIYQPNNTILADLIVDELLNTIQMYLPQIAVYREDIKVLSNKIDLFAEIRVRYVQDNTADLYLINLTNNQQEG